MIWKQQINFVAIKLIKANAILSKLRQFLDKKINSEVGLLCNILIPFTLRLSCLDTKHKLSQKTSFITEKIPHKNVFSVSKFPHRSFIQGLHNS